MNSSELVVAARWKVSAESLDAVVTLATELRERSLAEPGCLGYDVLRSVTEPTTLVVFERYRDDAALEAHRTSIHYREIVIARILPLLAERQVDVLRPRDSA